MMQNEENIDDEVKVSDSSLIIKIALAVAVIFGLISISIACVTGGFSISFIFAFFMAIISLIIALDANYNTRKMAQANLNGIVRKAFTSRYTFFKEIHNLESKGNIITDQELNKLAKQYMEFATWDMVLCLRQAKTLRKWANSENKNTFAQSLFILIDNVLPQKSKKILKIRHVEHLLISCNELIEIGVSKKYEKDIVDKFEKYSETKKERSECFQNYVKRKLDEVHTDPEGKLTAKEYIDKLFTGFK